MGQTDRESATLIEALQKSLSTAGRNAPGNRGQGGMGLSFSRFF